MKPKSKKSIKPKQVKGKVYWGYLNTENPFGVIGYKSRTYAETYLKLANQMWNTDKFKLVKLIMVEV